MLKLLSRLEVKSAFLRNEWNIYLSRQDCVLLPTSADTMSLLAFAAVRRAAAVHDGRRC